MNVACGRSLRALRHTCRGLRGKRLAVFPTDTSARTAPAEPAGSNRQHPWRPVLAWLVVLSVATGCSRAAPKRVRVTIVGIDGATWRVIDPLLARGELRHMAALLDHGVRASLRSRLPLVSPAVWTTIATGVFRQRHGILQFFSRRGNLYASTDRKVPALWNLASDAGLRSAVVGWWATYPAEAINGVIVSERALKIRESDLRDLSPGRPLNTDLARLVHPPAVADLVTDLVMNTPEESGARHAPENVVPRMRAEDAAVVRSLVLLRQGYGPFDLEMVLLRGVDPVSHYFWKYYEPEASPYSDERPAPASEDTKYTGTIEAYYRYVDTLLGELGARGSRDHVVMLISDHGFEAGWQKFHHGWLSGTHRSKAALDGILVAAGGPFRQATSLPEVSIADIAPTVLHLLSLPVADDLDGRVVSEALEETWLAAHPVRSVPSFGKMRPARKPAPSSPLDQRLRDELRALGYIE